MGDLSVRSKSSTPQSRIVDGVVQKQCRMCGVFKPLSDFHKAKNNYLYCRHDCKDCLSKYNRTKNLERKGLSIEGYDELYKTQEGKCFLCQKPYDKLSIDHCHSTREKRNLLCIACNIGLGCFKDDITILQRAIDYLKRFSNVMDT